MLAGTKTLIVFADNISPPHSDASQHPHLNRVSAEGVNGWLVVRRDENVCKQNPPGIALTQLLGVMPDKVSESRGDLANISGFESICDSGSDFRSRFCGLQIAVFTNAPPVMGLRKSLGIECDIIDSLEPRTDNAEALSSERISDLLLSRFESGAEIILLHLDAQYLSKPADSVDHDGSLRCMQLLDQIAGRVWGLGDGDILQCVLVAGRQHHDGKASLWGLTSAASANDSDAGGPYDAGEPLLAQLRPVQSCDMHDGQRVAPPPAGGEWREQRVMCAMHHRQGTRCDHVTALTPRQVLEKGETPRLAPRLPARCSPRPLPASPPGSGQRRRAPSPSRCSCKGEAVVGGIDRDYVPKCSIAFTAKDVHGSGSGSRIGRGGESIEWVDRGGHEVDGARLRGGISSSRALPSLPPHAEVEQ